MASSSCSRAALATARSLNVLAYETRPLSRSYACYTRDTPRRCTDGQPPRFHRSFVTLPKVPPMQSSTDINGQSASNVQSDTSTVRKDLSSSLEQDPSRVVHATTSDFFPPPSLQEDLHIASTANNAPSSVSSSYSSPRVIKIQRKDVPTEQLGSAENGASLDYRQSLDGYKYRVMKTPQLTNDILSAQVSDDLSPAINNLEGSEYNHYFNQDNNPAQTSLGLQQTITNGMNGDILTSHWWRTLYHNVVHPPTSRNVSSSNHPFQSASMRNRRASILLEEIINNSQQQFQEEEDEKVIAKIRVRSVQAASSIDVVAVLSKVFGGGVARTQQYDMDDISGNNNKLPSSNNNNPLSEFFDSSPPLRHVFGRTNIIIQLSPPPADCPPSLAPSVPRYVAIYRFGSVVFFNVTTKEASKLLEQIKKHSVDPIAVGFERREFFEMGLQPQLETATGVITADRAIVRELDMNTVGVVSNIMGQTVALDWHNDTVDELLASFSNINTSVERTGNFSSMERHMLFQVVARNNSLFIDMVSKLGIKDRSDTAWHLSQYEGKPL